jgi:NAD-dependent dihydropyrimidine dehydrogenase PreA subunit
VGAVRDAFGIVCVRSKRAAWEKPRCEEKLCMSCGICLDACPAHCLDWSAPVLRGEYHAYPFLKEEKRCLGCGFCAEECPVGAMVMTAPAAAEGEPDA